MDRHAATRRLRHLAEAAGIQIARAHPHMLRHTYVTTMLDAGADLRDVQIAARHADPRTTMRYDRARQQPGPPPELHPGRLHGVRHVTQPTSLAAGAARGVRHCRNECFIQAYIYARNGILTHALSTFLTIAVQPYQSF